MAEPFRLRAVGDATRVIEITGDVTAQSEEVLLDAYERASEPGVTAIVLDFDNLAYMNSGGIGLLVMLLVRTQRAGQRMHAFGLSDHYRKIFELTRLDERIAIHAGGADTLAAAIEGEGS